MRDLHTIVRGNARCNATNYVQGLVRAHAHEHAAYMICQELKRLNWLQPKNAFFHTFRAGEVKLRVTISQLPGVTLEAFLTFAMLFSPYANLHFKFHRRRVVLF